MACLPSLATLHLRTDSGAILWPPVLQIALFATVGLTAIVLAAAEAVRRRGAETALLGLWVVGTFLFASTGNWSINGRSILPAAPAVGILIVRAIECRRKQPSLSIKWALVPLVPAAFVGLWAAQADYALANAWKTAATEVCSRYAGSDRTLYTQGHWGFQYYSTQAGAVQMDASNCTVARGDVIVAPFGNTNLVPTPMDRVDVVETLEIPLTSMMATMQADAGAGFYSESAGPLPFAIGPAPNLRVGVAIVRTPFNLVYTPADPDDRP